MSQTKAQLLNPLGDFELTGQLIGVGATFSGNVSIAGTLTKQDVTNVDSVGLITARLGVAYGTGVGATIHSPASNTLALGTNGAERVRINSSGQTLINTTSANDGAVMLGVKNPTATDTVLDVVCGSTSHGSHVAFSDTEYARGIISYNHANNFLAFRTNGVTTDRLHITSAGDIGIGTNNPAAILDARGNVQFGDGGGFDMNILGTRHQFSINGDEKLRIDSDGRLLVGINASTAADALVQSFKPTGNNSTIVVGNVATSSSGLARLDFAPSNSTVGARIECHATEDFSDGSKRTADLVFVTRKDGAQSEKLRIGSAGQIGIAGANYGTAGQVLASGGSGATPSWTTISAAPEVEGTASGAITAHKSCVVNANGTISQVLQTVVPATTTKQDTELTNNGTYFTGDVKWLTSDKFLMLGRKINESNKARYFFGSVTSAGAITLTNSNSWTGNYQEAWNQRIAVDSSTNKFLALTQLDGDNAIYMRAGEVNGGGTDISWSSGNWWNVGSGQKTSTVATDNNGGYMIAFRNSNDDIEFRHVELDGSGNPNSVSSGAAWTYYNTNNGDYANYENQITMEYIPSVGAYWCVIVDSHRFYYSPNGIWLVNHGYFRACWAKSNGTGSAPTLTQATSGAIFAGGASNTDPGHAGGMGYDPRLVYDPTSGKGILAYRPNFGSGKGKALVLTFTDTSAQPTYVGSGVEVTQNSCSGLSVTVTTNTNVKKVVFYSSETGNTLVRSFDVSGNTLVGAGNTLNIFPGQHYQNLVVDSNNFDTGKARLITMTQDEGNGEYLSASTVDLPIVNTNLTDENFIGFAADSYADTATAKVKVVGNTSTQSGLTTAQKYYVKWDGTLSTSPDPQGAPSVTAGRALSSTSLLIQPA